MGIQYASKVMTNSLVVNISDSTVNTLPVNFCWSCNCKINIINYDRFSSKDILTQY